MLRPRLVLAADWSVSARKRWMARAVRDEKGRYWVHKPEPVGPVDRLIPDLQADLPAGETALVGFDFPMGLPRAYAEKAGIEVWRDGLGRPGVVAAEIYPRHAYDQLALPLAAGRGKKSSRPTRLKQAPRILAFERAHKDEVCFTPLLKSWIEWGFMDEDDFDALVGLLGMLETILHPHRGVVPAEVHLQKNHHLNVIEGWILGQVPESAPTAT